MRNLNKMIGYCILKYLGSKFPKKLDSFLID